MKREFTRLPSAIPVAWRNHSPVFSDRSCKTFLLMGLARSGASATAALLNQMGVPMDGSNDGHFERILFKDYVRDESILREEIDRLNEQHDVWGLQCWHRWIDVVTISRMVRNPHLVCVFRDPIALVTRWTSVGQGGSKDSMLQIKKEMDELMMIFRETWYPVMGVSFERLREDPKVAVLHMAEFLGMTINPEDLPRIVSVVNSESDYLIQN